MDEVLINTTTAGIQRQPAVCGLQGTQFVVVWEDRNDNTIKGQMFGASGVTSSSEMLINLPTPPGPRRRLPAIVEYGFGFVVAWNEQAAGHPANAPAQVKLRIFDADTLSGPEIQVSHIAGRARTSARIGAPERRKFHRRLGRQAGRRADPRATLRPDGTRIGPEFRANTFPDCTGCRWWRASPTATSSSPGARASRRFTFRFQIFNAQGTCGRRTITQPTATEAAMTALDNGQFVIAYLDDVGEDATANTLIVVEADVYNADGSAANRHVLSTGETRIHSSWPTLVPLSGGRFLISWVQHNVDRVPATTNVKARVFSTQGPLGQVAQFNTSSGSSRFSLAAVALSGPGGEIAFAAWADDTQSGGDTSRRAVRGRPLQVPAAGSRCRRLRLHKSADRLCAKCAAPSQRLGAITPGNECEFGGTHVRRRSQG